MFSLPRAASSCSAAPRASCPRAWRSQGSLILQGAIASLAALAAAGPRSPRRRWCPTSRPHPGAAWRSSAAPRCPPPAAWSHDSTWRAAPRVSRAPCRPSFCAHATRWLARKICGPASGTWICGGSQSPLQRTLEVVVGAQRGVVRASPVIAAAAAEPSSLAQQPIARLGRLACSMPDDHVAASWTSSRLDKYTPEACRPGCLRLSVVGDPT